MVRPTRQICLGGTGELWQRNAQEELQEEETGVDILGSRRRVEDDGATRKSFKNRGKGSSSRRDVTCSGKNTRTGGSAKAHGSRLYHRKGFV